jgi:short-subunit dehydrogenase
MTEFADKRVLITGAGGGFGREMVRQFRAAGARLVLTDLSETALEPAVVAAGDALLAAVSADLATASGIDEVVATCTTADILPDILVNNAGIGLAGRVDHVPRARWETLVQLNLLAPMRLCHLLLPAMVERGSGHVINISSLAGWVGSEGLSSYCATKYGLRGFGEALAADLHDTGVRVSNVYPCFSRTPILDSPQFGYSQPRKVPEFLVSEPADVIAAVIDGVQRNRLHIFPDKHSRRIHYITRFAPWVLPMLNRRMQAASVDAGMETG